MTLQIHGGKGIIQPMALRQLETHTEKDKTESLSHTVNKN